MLHKIVNPINIKFIKKPIIENIIATVIGGIKLYFIVEIWLKPYFFSNVIKNTKNEDCKYRIHLLNEIGEIALRNRSLSDYELNLLNNKNLKSSQKLNRETYICAIANGKEVKLIKNEGKFYNISFNLNDNKQVAGYIANKYFGESTLYFCDKPHISNDEKNDDLLPNGYDLSEGPR